MSQPTPDSNLSIPLKLDAFILNPEVCNGGEIDSKIAPITQPNYTFLRLTNFIVQNEILNHVDLHHTTPPDWNSRLTDLGTGERRAHRQGAYVHWMVPRLYRTGIASTDSGSDKRQQDGLPKPEDPTNSDKNAPQYRVVPNRWLVIRRLHDGTAFPENSGIPELQAWVVESDRRHDIKTLGEEVDLQTDVSPFVYPTRQAQIEQQAEVFIGYRCPAEDWTEVGDSVDRVPLSLFNGGNIFFTDFQQHNSNVFSIIDNFSYPDPEDNTKVLYLEKAAASYYVIGWHADSTDDPFYITQPSADDPSTSTIKRADRLKTCQMTLNAPESLDATEWLKSAESSRVLCHGAMYNVEWDLHKKPVTPADAYSSDLNKNIPVSVGTTPLDSLLAYISAHKNGEGDPVVASLIDSVIHIQTLLIAQDDTVDSQSQAKDLIYNYNYDAVGGGTHYYIAGSNEAGKPAEPLNPQDRDNLATLNREQYRLDLIRRATTRLRWELFSWWWKYICDSKNKLTDEKTYYRLKVRDCMTRWKDLNRWAGNAREIISGALLALPQAKPGVLPNFHKQRDPTLLVGGVESGWPHDWLDMLKARLDEEITTWADPDSSPNNIDWTVVRDVAIPKMPEAIQSTAKALVKEFFKMTSIGATAPPGTYLPLYHDQIEDPNLDAITEASWRDRWGGRQPWFPLFLEWEAEYTHIPYPDNWSLDERLTSPQPGELKKLRYGIKDGVDLSDPLRPNKDDKRTLSGRVLILPQPSFSLRTKIQQLFDNTPPEKLEDILPKDKREQLLKELHRLSFLSSPMAGLHDHLLTMVQGTHIKPNIRHSGEKLLPIDAARAPSAGFDLEQFSIIGTETDLTPYGSLVQFYDSIYSPFKPVTHGQFKFTKLNIIDKFGQAIHAIDPRWSATAPPPLYPCISEFYAPQLLGGNTPNTVEPSQPGLCEFVQLPPTINQISRLNASFVKRDDKDKKSWIPQSEWENPIWGWVVINYAENGIQLFLPDGTFYREVRVGGRLGATTSDEWLPFARPEHEPDTNQLDHLMRKLGNRHYLRAFVDMINGALRLAAPAPDAYAQFLSSVVGKPLALVNMAWSLELAEDAYSNQSTLTKATQERWLLPEHNAPPRDLYTFKFKLGDRERSYDGLVGYFKTKKEQDRGDDLELDKLYTFFDSKEPESPLEIIEESNFPLLKPHYTDPSKSAIEMERMRNSYLGLNAYGAIVDPFTPIHGYSGILPTQTLKLPTWTWQEAMNRMTAFFHIGPLVMTADVPAYDPAYRLEGDRYLKDDTTVPKGAVGVPALPAADWNWLQPYSVWNAGIDEEETSFMALGLSATDTRPRFEQGPYMSIEGYLQLKKPIVRAE